MSDLKGVLLFLKKQAIRNTLMQPFGSTPVWGDLFLFFFKPKFNPDFNKIIWKLVAYGKARVNTFRPSGKKGNTYLNKPAT